MQIKKYLASKYDRFIDKYSDLAMVLSGSAAALSGTATVASTAADLMSDATFYSASAFATSVALTGMLLAAKEKKIEDEILLRKSK